MLYDPGAKYTLDVPAQEYRGAEALDFLHYSLLASNTTQGAAAPLVMPMLVDELSSVLNLSGFRAKLFAMFAGSPRKALRAEVEAQLGLQLPIQDDRLVAEMVTEARRFQWLEAERVGRDIWKERNPKNPEASALREWFRLHFGAWYLAQATQR